MKNSIFAFLSPAFFALFFNPNFGQSQLAIGLSSGANFATQKISNPFFEPQPTIFFSAAASFEYRFKTGFAAAAEFSHLGKGYREKVEFTDANGTGLGESGIKTRFRYFEMATLLKYGVEMGFARLWLLVGPSVGQMLDGRVLFGKTLVVNGVETDSEEINLDGYEKSDFSLNGGIGLEFPFSKQLSATFETRYRHGLSKNSTGAMNYDFQNRGVGVSAGLAYFFAKK